MKNIAKSLVVFTAFYFFSFAITAQDLPQTSQKCSISQTVGLTDITVVYSRPNAKGREIFGELVPYDKVWRTGANATTTIEFNSFVTVQGQTLAPGKYAVFTKPKDDGVWEVMFNTNWDSWGTRDYKPEFDIVTVTAPVQTMNDYTETFTIEFDHVLGDDAMMVISWANTRVDVSIQANSSAQAMKNIAKKVKEIDNTFSAYNRIASYYLKNEIDPVQALKYAELSVDLNKKFFNLSTLAEAYAANNNLSKAIEAAKESLALSQKAGNKTYSKRNEDNIAKWQSK